MSSGEANQRLYERDLEKTSTWAVAVVCFVLLAISIFIEHVIHLVEKFLTKRRKPALVEALEKVKSELMLLGFISLLLTVFQSTISNMCISKSVASTWHPCPEGSTTTKTYGEESRRRLLDFDDEFGFEGVPRRSLATKGYDKCTDKGKVAFVTAYGIHQLHIFIFVLAIFHVLYCITTLALGTIKMKKWKVWENETKTLQYQYHNDPERFRFARETSFGRRHLNFWSRSPITLWILCFFRQFFGSVDKVDYMALRHGFIMAHFTAERETTFDFQKYIHRSLEKDFKEVVGISPVIWFSAVVFLLTNTYGWYSYYWLPFIPLIIILVVGTKLQVIITRMGLRIQERGDVVKGTPVVQPGDDLFWFGKPRFILFLVNFVLFLNAFQLAFFAWSTYEWGINSCFHHNTQDIVIRISMGVIIQILCSYVTLPLYALVTQMGSTMKGTVFDDKVATAVNHWHHTARKNTRHGRHSNSTTPFSSRPATPEHGTSPMHLLHNFPNRSIDSLHTSPRASDVEDDQWANIGLNNVEGDDSRYSRHPETRGPVAEAAQLTSLTQAEEEPPVAASTQHEIDVPSSDFSFRKHG